MPVKFLGTILDFVWWPYEALAPFRIEFLKKGIKFFTKGG